VGSSPAPPHALNSNAARVRETTTWRRGAAGGRVGGRGTAYSRLRRSGKRRLGSHAAAPPCQGDAATQTRLAAPPGPVGWRLRRGRGGLARSGRGATRAG